MSVPAAKLQAPVEADRWIQATYRVQAPASAIEARAQAIALEQSIELPLNAVRDPRVLSDVVARVADIVPAGPETFAVTLQLAAETTGFEAGQLLNMLFGNTSLQDDVALVDVAMPAAFTARFGGPRFGIDGIREIAGVHGRPLTCSALKPLGLDPGQYAAIARTFVRAGIDVIKDDHGLADQAIAPFTARVREVQRAVDAVNREIGAHCIYAPSVTGSYDRICEQVAEARSRGVRMLLIAPMVTGVAALSALARDAAIPIIAHPALAGSMRIAAPLLLGKLFRLFGADATIFPNAGGRFGYGPEICAGIGDAARVPWQHLAPTLPVPAGGMSVERVSEMVERFGDDAMLLIGGNLLTAGDQLLSRCRAFVDAVSAHGVRR
jgi:ribulose-bisphosphate carboxylase large chain